MPFIDINPLNYPINTPNSIRRFQDDRAPTDADYKNFKLGDEWLDSSSIDWYKLCYKDSTKATWRRMAGTAGSVESFIPDGGTSPVLPSAANQVTVAGGNGIETVGGVNQWTTQMSSPFTGSFAFENTTAATPLSLTIENNDVNAASTAFLKVSSEPLGGDSYILWEVDGTQSYSFGVDNDSSDTLKLTDSSTPSTGNVLFQITAAGVPTFPTAPLDVPSGGTGAITLTDHGVLLGSGAGAISATVVGNAGQPLLSGGAGVDPDWGTLSVNYGGTGTTSLTDHGILVGSGTSAITALAVLTDGQLLRGVTGADPAATSFTIPSSFAQGDLLLASSANTITALSKDVNATRYLANTGASNNAAWDQVNLTNGVTGTLPVTSGGLGIATVTQGDILYASAANTLATLSKDATATRYLANTGASNNPEWNQVDLTTGVTNTLPVASGGTGAIILTDHGVLVGSGTGAITPLTAASSGTVLTGVTGADPSFSATPTVTTIYATTFDTNVATAAVTLAGTTLAADGTDVDIDINITPKGAGNVVISSVDINGGSVDGITLGTVSAVTEAQIDNININGNTISSTSGDVNITPNAGDDVVIDGHWEFDGAALTALTDNDSVITAYAGKNITIEDVTFDGGVVADITDLTSIAIRAGTDADEGSLYINGPDGGGVGYPERTLNFQRVGTTYWAIKYYANSASPWQNRISFYQALDNAGGAVGKHRLVFDDNQIFPNNSSENTLGTSTKKWLSVYSDTVYTNDISTTAGDLNIAPVGFVGFNEASPETYVHITSNSKNLLLESNGTQQLFIRDNTGSVGYKHTYLQQVSDSFYLGYCADDFSGSTDMVRLKSDGTSGNLWVRQITQSYDAPSNETFFTISNTSNTATTSGSAIKVSVGGDTSLGDPYINWLVTGSTTYSAGIDNNDANNWKLTTGSTPSAGTELIEIESDATDANLNIENITQSMNKTGTVAYNVGNTDNTVGVSSCALKISTGGGTAGDPYISWSVAGGGEFVAGIDNSNADYFKLTTGSDPSSGTVILRANSSGLAGFPQTLGVGTSAATANYTFDSYKNADNVHYNRFYNASNTSNARSVVYISTAGSTANDPELRFGIQGVNTWSVGIDNSDGDSLAINSIAGLGTWKWKMDTSGARIMPSQPAFLAYNSSKDFNKTGTGTLVDPVEFDSEVFDQNSDYDNATDTFTAPVTGQYYFKVGLTLGDISSSMTRVEIKLETSNRTCLVAKLNPGAVYSDIYDLYLADSFITDMDAGDTAKVTVAVWGAAADDVDIYGGFGGSPLYTHFGAMLLC